MKTNLLIAALFALAFTSCRKDRACTCTSKTSEAKVTYTRISNADAKALCYSYKVEQNGRVLDEVDCKLE